MNDYKRKTERYIDLTKLSEKAKSRISDTYIQYTKMNNALYELEDKIENGTLVDTTKEYYFITNNIEPTIVKSPLILGFNRRQGIVRWVDNEPRCICTNEAEAKVKLKELKNEK